MNATSGSVQAKDKFANANLVHYLVDITAVAMLIGAFAVGFRFWESWFAETDSVVCTICIAFGVLLALLRGLTLEPIHKRQIVPWGCFVLAFMVLFFAVVAGRSKLTGIAVGLVMMGWLAHRLRGEGITQAISLGIAFMVPSFVNAFEDRGAFEIVEDAVLNLTSGLSESMTQFHILRGDVIEYGHGVANRFSSVGRWDSILPFVGIAFFCIYAFQRAFVSSLLTLSMAFLVWMAVRASAWVSFAWYAEAYGVWPEWTLGVEVFLFCTGAVLILCLDQFFASLLAPIPAEFINEDVPLVAYVWNWFVLLPSLEFSPPSRARETFDDDLEEE